MLSEIRLTEHLLEVLSEILSVARTAGALSHCGVVSHCAGCWSLVAVRTRSVER